MCTTSYCTRTQQLSPFSRLLRYELQFFCQLSRNHSGTIAFRSPHHLLHFQSCGNFNITTLFGQNLKTYEQWDLSRQKMRESSRNGERLRDSSNLCYFSHQITTLSFPPLKLTPCVTLPTTLRHFAAFLSFFHSKYEDVNED